jgi:class 3 adenylate cyclase
MQERRRLHFEQGRRWLRKEGGYEIKTIGDSLMVAFRTPASALNFALAFHRQTGHEQIKIRAGIHVGQVYIEEEDAYGTMVNYAARVQNQAEGPEIWLSDRAKGDIYEQRSRVHENLHWAEFKDCKLKGFPGTHRLWSVRHSQKVPYRPSRGAV